MCTFWDCFPAKANWKICELLHDITANVISTGIFPMQRVWSSQQMMFFTTARLHTRNQYYIQQQQLAVGWHGVGSYV